MNDPKLLARYQRLRLVGRDVNNALARTLPRDVIGEGGHKLGILQGRALVLDSEDQIALLMDYCIHDVRRDGRTAVERMLARNPYRPGSDEALFLEALQGAWYTLFEVETLEPGAGVRGRDMLRDEPFFLHDIAFSRSAVPGLVLASRLMVMETMTMTTGAALPVGVRTRKWGDPMQELIDLIQAQWEQATTPEQRSEVTAAVIQTCLQAGAGAQITYAEPNDPRAALPGTVSGRRAAAGVGKYDPCPCGSGKKFKFCCGARR